MLLWTRGCRYLFEWVFSFALNIFPEVKLLDYMVIPFLIFWGSTILFSIVAVPLFTVYNPTNSAQGFPFLHILTSICYLFSFLVMAILTGRRWHLIVFLTCSFLTTSDLSIFSCIYIIIFNREYLKTTHISYTI